MVIIYIARNVRKYFTAGAVVYFGGWFVVQFRGYILSLAEIKVFARDMAFVRDCRFSVFLFCRSVWGGVDLVVGRLWNYVVIMDLFQILLITTIH